MSYCIGCGRPVEPTALVCECGQDLTAYLPPQVTNGPATSFQPPEMAPPPPPAPLEVRSFFARFLGDGWTLFTLHLVNILLTVLTLGIYYFWAKAKVRRYLYGQTEFEGARFGYHGTGKELLIGWLRAALFFAAYFALLLVAQGVLGKEWGPIVATLVLYVALIFLVPMILLGAWRFAMSRTSYRGIRFSHSADKAAFTRSYIKGALLSAITLSFYTPFFLNDLRGWFARGARFGNRSFGYDGEGGPLLWPYVLNILLLIPTLGIYSFWFRARLQRHFWNHTTFGSARFNCTITGGGLLGLGLTNLLLVVFTLGLGTPWAKIRSIRYVLDNLSLRGALDFSTIVQDMRAASATGEQLADMLDIGDTGFDVGI